MSRKNNILTKFNPTMLDMPSFAMLGALIGFLLMWLMWCIDSIVEAPTDKMISWQHLVAGLACLGMAIVISLLQSLYWFIVIRKRRIIQTPLLIAGPLVALCAIFSAVLVGIEMYYKILNQLSNIS